MIIWLNGAFGTGKTTAACELHRRLPDSFVCDPENVGCFLRKNMPPACHTPDFQDMALWRCFSRRMLKELHESYGGTVIVPMTLVNPAYYEEIICRLLDEGVPVVHIVLYACRETILKRLRKRSLGQLGRESFAVEAIDRCQEFFARCDPGTRIETDHMSVSQIVERIGEMCGLPLLPDRRGRLAGEVGRWMVTLRHIRN